MTKKALLVIVFIFSFYLSTSLLADNELLFKVRKTLTNLSPFYLDFKQQVFDDTDLIAEESGNISYINIDKVKWVYNDPEYKVFLLEKNNYQFYDKESSQLTKGRVKENRQKWILQILFSESITDQVTYNKKEKIIYIKNKEDGVDLSVYIGADNFPHKVIQLQDAGIKYIYYFTGYKTKYKFPANIFNLNLPKNTEIVEME